MMSALLASVRPADSGLLSLMETRSFFWLIIAAVVVVVVLARTTGQVLRTLARERSRREIAAFIAEGSMTPEQGERLLKAGETPERAC